MKKISSIFLAVVFLSLIGLPSAHADLYVSSTDGTLDSTGIIYRYNKVIGDLVPVPGLSGLIDPRRLVIRPNGDIYVITSSGNGKVLRFGYNEETETYGQVGSIETFIPSESLALGGPDSDNPEFLYLSLIHI